MVEYKYRGRSDPKINEETELELIDMATKEKFKAKVLASPRVEDLPEGDVLWIENESRYTESRPDNCWRVKILELIEEEEEEEEIKVTRVVMSAGKKKGDLLASLIQERQKEEH